MECPGCHRPMIRGEEFWICEQCWWSRIPLATDAPPAAPGPVGPFARLPSVLAIPLWEYASESHPVMRLHRLCDAVEILTRFGTIVALGELRQRLGDAPFPERLTQVLREQIERPTLGQWKNMLQTAVEHLGRGVPLVVPELRDFATQHLLPGLERGPHPAAPGRPHEGAGLIDLRNTLVHGGAMPRAEARRQLDKWEPWLEGVVWNLDFLTRTDLCFLADDGARRLTGPTIALGEERPLSADLRLALARLPRHVVLLRVVDPPRGECWVDLWPLCDFGRARAGPRVAGADSPLVYIRAERDRLLYAALGVELPHGENRDVLAEFRALFRLTDRRQADPVEVSDFEAEIRLDEAALVGRVDEIKQALAALKAAQSGVFWLGGQGGLGKSFLTARLARDPALMGNPKKVCRIAWRFLASDQNRCHRVAFFRHAVARLAAWLSKPDLIPAQEAGALFGQLRDLLDQVAEQKAGPHPQARPPRIVFVLDGLDEIARRDPDFADVPFSLSRPNVVWLCAGRPEGALPETFSAQRCTQLFGGSLPPMSDADIRGMLLDGTGALKYDLLRLDREPPGGGADPAAATNAAVEAVVRKAAGLPLYVRFVVDDILAGRYRIEELDGLPPTLNAYYDEVLSRRGLGEVQA